MIRNLNLIIGGVVVNTIAVEAEHIVEQEGAGPGWVLRGSTLVPPLSSYEAQRDALNQAIADLQNKENPSAEDVQVLGEMQVELASVISSINAYQGDNTT